MWLWLDCVAKPDATAEAITERRLSWMAQSQDQRLGALCRSAQRFVVTGEKPPRVLWLLETDDRKAVTLITEHFGELWEITVHQATPQTIAQASVGKPKSPGGKRQVTSDGADTSHGV